MSSRSSFPFSTRRRGGRRPPSWSRLSPQRLILLLVVAAGLLVARSLQKQELAEPVGDLAEGVYRVKRALDGDTLELAGGQRVRLIGVDTPETVKPNTPVEPFGPEASAMTKQFVSEGEVRLQFDDDRRDKYGRYLAYVWVGDQMLNEELLRAGLAVAEMQYHYSAAMKDRFRRAQAQAQAVRRGIWSQ